MLFCETYQPGTHRSVTLYPPSLRMLAIPRLVATTSALFIFSWTLSSALALAEFPLVPAEILKSLLRVFLTVSGISCTIPWSKPYSIDGREVLVYNMQWVSSCPIQQGGKWYKSSGLSVSGQPGQNGGFREPICSASSLSFFFTKGCIIGNTGCLYLATSSPCHCNAYTESELPYTPISIWTAPSCFAPQYPTLESQHSPWDTG